MTERWLEGFFRARRVAVLAIPRAERSPLTTPVWYDYDGTRFRVQVEAISAKARSLAASETTPVSLTIQSEVPPYRYAVIHSQARLVANDQPGMQRRLARRYFGRMVGDRYVDEETKRGVDDAALRIIEITPERTLSHDFRPSAGIVGRAYFAIHRWLRPVPA